MACLRIALVGIVATCAAWTAGLATGGTVVVYFVDGRSMVVDDLERQDDLLILYLVDGGTLSVPYQRISEWKAASGRRAGPPGRSGPEAEPLDAALWWNVAGEYAELFASAAAEHDLDPALLTAMAQVESAFDPRAVSPKGAAGLLQLMPDTADRFGVDDVFDVAQNVSGGARYMSWLLERFDGRTDLALAGYNAGEGAVDRHQGIPPYSETRRYVRKVLDGAARLADLAP